jgi:ferric-dicitrate binding protein FerR (iron transport regulator)
MNCDDARDLMQPFVDGELGEVARQRLIAHTRDCEACCLALEQRRRLVKAAGAGLGSQAPAPAGLAPAVSARLSQEPALTRGVLGSTRRPAPRLRRAWLAAGAAAAVLLIALALANTFSPGLIKAPSWLAPGRLSAESLVAVAAVQQPATDARGGALEVGDRLPAGSTIRTGTGARVTLVTRRGSELTLNADSELSLLRDGSGAALRAGEVYCRSRGGEIAVIETDAGSLHLLGTTLDAVTQDGDTAAVTVVEGQVRLSNPHGETVVDAGRRAVITAALPPQEGVPVDTLAQTAWYHGCRDIVSDFGDISYLVRRKQAAGLVTEVWTMKADGTGKRHVKSYLGWNRTPGTWLSDREWLLLETHSAHWTRPDLEHRQAHIRAGFPFLWNAPVVFLNTATGQEIPLQIPPEYRLWRISTSPDGTKAIFTGAYWPDFPDGPHEGGAWLYHVQTGDVVKLTDSIVNDLCSWSPDSRFLAISLRDENEYSGALALMHTTDGRLEKLQPQGMMAALSPDGTRLAYCSDREWGPRGRWRDRIFVLDLASDSPPLAVTPMILRGISPRWSPDGSRIAYQENHEAVIDPDEGPVIPAYALWVAAADGSGAQKIYEADEKLYTHSWARSGDALYVSTDRGIYLVAADGSGVIANLGGTEEDSVLDPQSQAQMDAALSALQEAVFRFAVAEVREFEGKPRECKAAFSKAAEALAALPYDYPLARFSMDHALLHADVAQPLADRSDPIVLSDSCKDRLRYAGSLLYQYVEEHGELPRSAAALEERSLAARWGIDWISCEDTEWVRMMFRCPVGGAYVYLPPRNDEPSVGDVIIRCPVHSENKLVWTERLAQSFTRHREAAARAASE